jgi:tetratricopeptide (TPR) repeat protein
MGPKGIGLALAKPAGLGPLLVHELEVFLPGLSFPLDVSGGVNRFRHRRGELRRFRIGGSWDDIARFCAPKLVDLIASGTPRVRIEEGPETTLGVELAGLDDTHAPVVLAFEIGVRITDDDVEIVAWDARGANLASPAPRLASEAVARILGPSFERRGSSFGLSKLATRVSARLLPEAGARTPRVPVVGPSGITLDTRGFEITFREGRGFVGGERALRAAEDARLAEAADTAFAESDFATAREELLSALSKAPRHPGLSGRLIALDALAEGRVEVALATLRDAEREGLALRLGDLPTSLRARAGDVGGALGRAIRDAEREPRATLRAALRLRAGELDPDPLTALHQLDEATSDAPERAFVRRARLLRALDAGRFDEAEADTGFLEALAREPRDKCRALVDVGNAYVSRGLRERARTPFEHALKYVPDDPEALAGLGAALVAAGLGARGAALLTRAIDVATSPEVAAKASLALARVLEDPLGDHPAAAARAREIPSGLPESAEARLLEGRVRAAVGDLEGAKLALARLREETLGRDHVPLLVAAARLEQNVLCDKVAALRSVRRAEALAPLDRALLELERELGTPQAERVHHVPAPPSSSSLLGRSAVQPLDSDVGRESSRGFADRPSTARRAIDSVLEPSEAERGAAPSDPDLLEARIEGLTEKLRADPTRDEVVDELVDVLSRLGRGLELLALLSARLEDAPPERRATLVVHQRVVLEKLESEAKAAGRLEEASLFAMSRDALAYS